MLDRRTLLTGAAAAATTAVTATGALVAPPASGAVRATRVLARDLQVPWGLAFLPTGDALVAERNTGRVHRVGRRGGQSRIGAVSGVVSEGEGGLLGLALHPGFARNRWVYAYTTTANDNRVVRFRYVADRLTDQQAVVTGIPRGDRIHNGGRLRFGPDGMLYVATGDAGDTGNSQDRDSLGGKILRVTPRGAVPAGNPFGDSPVWTLGHRNVQGLAFDGRGRLWATELGQSTRDELNRIVAGGNYGWPGVEGGDGAGPVRDPFVTWSPTSTCSPSGVAILGGRAWVGALAGQALKQVVVTGPGARRTRQFFRGTYGRIRTVEKAPDGSLWITTSNSGRGGSVEAPRDDRVIRVVVS